MRINLNCPYGEKDDAKRLGARWDAARKVWYIENKEDLTPFMRWMSEVIKEKTLSAKDKRGEKVKRPKPNQRPVREGEVYATTGTLASACACVALPWEDCEHTSSIFAMLTDKPLPPSRQY